MTIENNMVNMAANRNALITFEYINSKFAWMRERKQSGRCDDNATNEEATAMESKQKTPLFPSNFSIIFH